MQINQRGFHGTVKLNYFNEKLDQRFLSEPRPIELYLKRTLKISRECPLNPKCAGMGRLKAHMESWRPTGAREGSHPAVAIVRGSNPSLRKS
jgi:hypothetical protein